MRVNIFVCTHELNKIHSDDEIFVPSPSNRVEKCFIERRKRVSSLAFPSRRGEIPRGKENKGRAKNRTRLFQPICTILELNLFPKEIKIIILEKCILLELKH